MTAANFETVDPAQIVVRRGGKPSRLGEFVGRPNALYGEYGSIDVARSYAWQLNSRAKAGGIDVRFAARQLVDGRFVIIANLEAAS